MAGIGIMQTHRDKTNCTQHPGWEDLSIAHEEIKEPLFQLMTKHGVAVTEAADPLNQPHDVFAGCPGGNTGRVIFHGPTTRVDEAKSWLQEL